MLVLNSLRFRKVSAFPAHTGPLSLWSAGQAPSTLAALRQSRNKRGGVKSPTARDIRLPQGWWIEAGSMLLSPDQEWVLVAGCGWRSRWGMVGEMPDKDLKESVRGLLTQNWDRQGSGVWHMRTSHRVQEAERTPDSASRLCRGRRKQSRSGGRACIWRQGNWNRFSKILQSFSFLVCEVGKTIPSPNLWSFFVVLPSPWLCVQPSAFSASRGRWKWQCANSKPGPQEVMWVSASFHAAVIAFRRHASATLLVQGGWEPWRPELPQLSTVQVRWFPADPQI